MNRNKAVQIIILLAVLAVGGITIASGAFSANSSVPKAGDMAPEFTLAGLDGADHSLSDYRGKAVMINFWGSFCPPCVREMPAIQKQYEKTAGADFTVLGINLDESVVTVKSFINQHGVTFPILLDKDTVRERYGVTAFPTTFFLDKKGKIMVRHEGEMSEDFIKATLAKLLAD
ncbi:MAG TPA: redoxin domain-containing protein [Bacilli bacterium]